MKVSLHEGCVKLKVAVAGTHVITGRHDALHDQRYAHSIKNAHLGRYAVLVYMRHTLTEFRGESRSSPDHQHKEHAQDHVTGIAYHVIKVTDWTYRKVNLDKRNPYRDFLLSIQSVL